ncbi:MAG: 2-oxoglutarate dehydrogenase complex dihydrolipoyllysine-residue succinyltransferase [Rhodospirillaceae bacterium]|nr:2-oxoglutarate dehydrogenase complex dihydrolipoyllysine-residue succinyltransferase [Rhodospirillaceae bacterium]MBT5567091.1 2-oxoglutarate dehydrogenase complex dihydrolipoyllysine-residue succinyltransferase [Rhodospirillaceae bacterium]MBT6089516.1 2-oxoglutarate dehydrogenase complex dihydrolipoyllysine-residue succinyltransferase [Rhodospirillaceae bacterium]MBT6961242.1 2-oxoglutarate dehydrogenase complex dihydrolipoyllysine-residue succinyltransferase [Rhodospirillaceae bacterium]
MSREIKVPQLGESVSEATVAKWLKKPGEAVALDEPLVELETDKVTLEVNSPAAGSLSEIIAEEGADVEVGAVLAVLAEGAAGTAAAPKKDAPKKEEPKKAETPKAAAPAPAAAPSAPAPSLGAGYPLAPSVRRLVDEHHLDPNTIPATGKNGRLTKGDVLKYVASGGEGVVAPSVPDRGPREERVKMTRLRRSIAARLKEAQNTAAMLTTFNEVDMTSVMNARKQYQDAFVKKNGIKLGFMSFFAKACVTALKELPAVNGSIEGDEIVYKNYYDIGVAVGTPTGLVVPVVRDCDLKDLAAIEADISGYGMKARDGKLTMAEMTGGTFTISNGGTYGSMMSTPILNAPQSAVLGMHNIVQRAMVMPDGSIQARPMMYLALSYDHRIIDGREAVTFLVRVKQCLEDPARMLYDV